jgi:hypothetical protein
MAPPDDEVDRLYQLPIEEFTSARNALAKRVGAEGASIRALQKPTLAAWAVNQLFWRKRKVFDRLVVASERLRRAHRTRLTGKDVDVASDERAHQGALQAALEEITVLLTADGHAATGETILAATDTLRALPAEVPVGRLTEPLRSTGFGLLASLLHTEAKTTTPKADVVAFRRPNAERESPALPPKTKQPAAAEDRRKAAQERAAAKAEAARVRNRVADAKRELRAATTALRAAKAAADRSRDEFEKAQRERERLEEALDAATRRRDVLRSEVTRTAKAVAEADLVETQSAHRVRQLEKGSATIAVRGPRRDSNV